MAGGSISYEEFPTAGDRSGTIYFTDLNLEISGISNYPEDLRGNPIAKIKGNARLLGEGYIQAIFNIPLADAASSFTCKGSLGKMPLTAVNNILHSHLAMAAKSGKVDKLVFDISADKQMANGTMQFYYNDFELEFINSSTGKWQKWKQRLGNLFLKAIVYSDNPGKNGIFRASHIHYKRDQRKYIFNYLWKTMFEGIKQSTGLQFNGNAGSNAFKDNKTL